MKFRIFFLGVALCAWFTTLNAAFAQGTTFTYQGQLLVNGSEANGAFDLQFILLTSLTGTNQVGPALTNSAVVVANGVFTTQLNFGNVFGVNPLYLEIGVRPAGNTGDFSIVTPPQLITSAPYAIQALNASVFAGKILDTQLSTNVVLQNGNPVFTGHVTLNNVTATGTVGGTLSGTFSGTASGTFNGTATGTLVGNGSGVTNLNVTNLVGVVQSNPNWQIVQTSPQQTVVANNYLTTNSTATTLILPVSPVVGSTLRVAGSGANGFTLAQPTGQSILTAALNLPAGQLFVAPSGFAAQSWHAVAVSANGLKMTAAYSVGSIYYSNDGGQTWTVATGTGNTAWYGLAMSADGKRMLAVPNGGQPSISANGGTNWTQQAASGTAVFFTCCASSADGVKLVACANGLNAIYTSANGGTNWTQHAVVAQNWISVASSADGTKLAAAPNGSAQIYTSTDSGATWTNRGPTGVTWSSIASSTDGNKLVATASTGLIYTSGDSGVTWTPHASSQAWTCVTSSADGQNLAAAYHGYIYTSNDSGLNWQQRTNGVNSILSWTALGSSANGSRILAAINTGLLYTSTAATTVGATGFLAGSQYSSLEIQYIGNGNWMPLSTLGTFTAQ